MTTLFDSHCHLTSGALYPQVDNVIARAREAGVVDILTLAQDLDDAERAIRLSDEVPSVHVAAGIHPHESAKTPERWDEALASIVAREDVFAVGEIGLDYHYDFSDRPTQQRVFRRQLEIAVSVGKPVVIHSREAYEDTMNTLADHPSLQGVVFHCFSGSERQAAEILARGYYVSLTGVVTFKRSHELMAVARAIPSDRLMIETDAPYLSPEPVRNVRPNEPALLVHTASCIAKERGMDLAELASITSVNARRFFRIAPGCGE